MAVGLQGMVRAQELDMVCPLVKEHGTSIIQENYIASLPRTLVLQLMRFQQPGQEDKDPGAIPHWTLGIPVQLR